MLIYILLAFLPVTLSYLITLLFDADVNKDEDFKKIFIFIFGIALFFVIAFRSYELGSSDSSIYFNKWELLRDMSFEGLLEHKEESKMDFGFLLTVWAVSHILYFPQFIFILTGILFAISVCMFVYKNSKDVTISFVMYITLDLYVFMVQGMRQAIAMSICLFAIEYCKKRKFIPFVILILIAMQYHDTAIVFFVVYFLYGLKLNDKVITIFLILFASLVLFSNRIVSIANQLFKSNYTNTVKSGGFIAVAIYVIIVSVALVFSSQMLKNDKNYSFFTLITAIGFCVYILRYFGTQAAERISFYFMFGQMIVLPSVIDTFDDKSKRLLSLVVSTLCILLFVYRLRGSDLTPYNFFWQTGG